MKNVLLVGFLLLFNLSAFSQFSNDDSHSISSANEQEGSLSGTPVAPVPAKRKPATTSSHQSEQPSEDNQAPSSGENDPMYLQSDDYFVSEEAFTNQPWIWVQLAKMTTKSTSGSKGEAEFLKVLDGNQIWTKFYFKTVPARKADIRLGTIFIGFNDQVENGIYSAPADKESARGGAWFLGKITDVSDLYKGYVTIAGNYKVSVNNMRILTR